MRLILAAMSLLFLAACTPQSEELLPIPASIKGASFVSAVEIKVERTATPKIAELEQKAREKRLAPGTAEPAARPQQAEYAGLPFEQMMTLVVEDVTRSWGLRAGRAVKLIIEIHNIEMTSTAGALIGGKDRMAGSVHIRDSNNGEELGQLYVDVVNKHSGITGMLLRGGGIREGLAEQFATHIAQALSGQKRKPRAR